MSTELVVSENHFGRAWGRAIQHVLQPGTDRAIPLVVILSPPDGALAPSEDVTVRALLDTWLRSEQRLSLETVADTIFPRSTAARASSRDDLYDRYRRLFTRLRRIDSRNRRGTYFYRLMEMKNDSVVVNQLETIITSYERGVHRPSALQAAVFDPFRDHSTSPRLGFPCLQQVAFAPEPHDRALYMTAFFASQFIAARAYGNWLGLWRLGEWMADQLGLKMRRLTSVAGVGMLGCNKSDIRPMLPAIATLLSSGSSAVVPAGTP